MRDLLSDRFDADFLTFTCSGCGCQRFAVPLPWSSLQCACGLDWIVNAQGTAVQIHQFLCLRCGRRTRLQRALAEARCPCCNWHHSEDSSVYILPSKGP